METKTSATMLGLGVGDRASMVPRWVGAIVPCLGSLDPSSNLMITKYCRFLEDVAASKIVCCLCV